MASVSLGCQTVLFDLFEQAPKAFSGWSLSVGRSSFIRKRVNFRLTLLLDNSMYLPSLSLFLPHLFQCRKCGVVVFSKMASAGLPPTHTYDAYVLSRSLCLYSPLSRSKDDTENKQKVGKAQVSQTCWDFLVNKKEEKKIVQKKSSILNCHPSN